MQFLTVLEVADPLNDNVPLYIINILGTLFKNTEVCVHFNVFFSNSWQIRQGGVLSAYLFTYYIDNILKCVFKDYVECRIGINKFNILAYADDIVLMSPSASGLRILLNVINDCTNDHKLLINVK